MSVESHWRWKRKYEGKSLSNDSRRDKCMCFFRLLSSSAPDALVMRAFHLIHKALADSFMQTVPNAFGEMAQSRYRNLGRAYGKH